MSKKSQLVARLENWAAGNPAATQIRNLCKEHLIPAYYFGGVCRSCWQGKEPRDIDIVVDDLAWEKFQSLIPGPVRINRFGGLKFELGGTEIDAWSIEKTWAFAHGLSCPASPTLLPETTFLNIESVVALVWHPESPWVFEKNFFEAMESGRLEIQNPDNPDPALCLARIQKFLEQGWHEGESVKAFRQHHLSKGLTQAEIAAANLKHYNRHDTTPTPSPNSH